MLKALQWIFRCMHALHALATAVSAPYYLMMEPPIDSEGARLADSPAERFHQPQLHSRMHARTGKALGLPRDPLAKTRPGTGAVS